jgi:hypothetical protein
MRNRVATADVVFKVDGIRHSGSRIGYRDFAMILGEVTTQKAAKEHTCWWCGELIFQHETYVRWTWKNGNDLLSIKVHEECRKAWNELPSDEQEVEFSEFNRGCTCERDRCKCTDSTNYWSR